MRLNLKEKTTRAFRQMLNSTGSFENATARKLVAFGKRQNECAMPEHPCEVEQAAKCRLGQVGYAALKQVICEYSKENGVLTLRGWVTSYYLKQHAQEAVKTVVGVKQIENLLEVAKDR